MLLFGIIIFCCSSSAFSQSFQSSHNDVKDPGSTGGVKFDFRNSPSFLPSNVHIDEPESLDQLSDSESSIPVRAWWHPFVLTQNRDIEKTTTATPVPFNSRPRWINIAHPGSSLVPVAVPLAPARPPVEDRQPSRPSVQVQPVMPVPPVQIQPAVEAVPLRRPTTITTSPTTTSTKPIPSSTSSWSPVVVNDRPQPVWAAFYGHQVPAVSTPSSNVEVTAAADAVKPVPDGLRCGTPKVGGPDPFGLAPKNEKIWGDVPGSVRNTSKSFSVALTIVGGQDTDPQIVCWQAKIIKDGRFLCGASIIGRRTIVTASHCVYNIATRSNMTPERLKVVVGAPVSDTLADHGSQDPAGCAQKFNVVNFTSNPDFKYTTMADDIAILRLDADIDFRKPCVCPVCLSSRKPKVGEICAVSGYGLTEEKRMDSKEVRPLKFVQLNIKQTGSNDNCYIQSYGSQMPDFRKLVCAGDVPGQDTCQGDSGGPMVCLEPTSKRHYQVGIVSYGKGCARGIGGMYTRVSMFLDLIKRVSNGDILGLID